MATWAIITLVFSILATVGSTMAGVFTNAQNQQQARRNEQLAVENREDQQSFAREQQENANRATIEMFNTIDSPAAKVKQLKEAGLSTGLMYGQGGAGGSAHTSAMAGTPSSAAGVNAPFLNPVLSMFKDPTESLTNVAGTRKTEAETRKTEAETDKVFEETKKLEEETKTQVVTRNYTAAQTSLAEMELTKQSATMLKQIEIVEKEAELIKENVERTRKEIRGLEIDNENKGKLYESTLNLNDSLTQKYVAETAKATAEKVLVAAETKLKEAQTRLTDKQKLEVEQKIRQAKQIADEYEKFGYKATEANNWATELMSLLREIYGVAFGVEGDPELEFYDNTGRDKRLKGTGIHGGGATW